VLHVRARLAGALAELQRQAKRLADGGAEILVLGAGARARDTTDATRQGLAVALNPDFGTVIKRAAEVERLVVLSDVELCLDTGHLALGGCDPAALVGRVPARIRHIYLNDVRPDIAAAVGARTIAYADGVNRGPIYRWAREARGSARSCMRSNGRATTAGTSSSKTSC
jgi:sugar phosphate isomerase/epimerase